MSIYTVHVPDKAPDAVTRADRTIVLRDGFSPAAFVFGLLFFLRHRLWAVAAVWITLLLALSGFAFVLHPPLIGILALALLMHLYAGVEGPDLRRWSLTRRGFTMRDVVSAPDLETAEALALARMPETVRATSPAPARAARFMGPDAVPAVIGVFPDGGAA